MEKMNKHNEENFQQKLSQILNSALVVPGLAIGHNLGLFEIMAKLDAPLTATELARAGGFKERYIEEWLFNMTMAGMVKYVSSSRTYFLPRHHRRPLETMGYKAWLLPVIAEAYKDVRDCFPLDGPTGTTYDAYPSFHDWFEERNRLVYTKETLLGVIEDVPGLKVKLDAGATLCHVGCGCGTILLILARLFPHSTFMGIDIDEDVIVNARNQATLKQISNVDFQMVNVYEMPRDWTNQWDHVLAFDVIHDLPYPDQALRDICKVVKPGCYLSVVDANTSVHPKQNDSMGVLHATTVAAMSLFFCVPISLGYDHGSGVGGAWSQELAIKLMNEAGFHVEKTLNMRHNKNTHYLCKK